MQKLQLSIPEPCHENWQQMTPTQQGRYCNACAKEVIDFSTMTDIQVLNYFTNLTNEKVCGRALPEQLDRAISRPETPKKKLFWYWNYVVMLFMVFTKANAAKAQSNTKPATELSPVDIKGDVVATDVEKLRYSRVITGKVTDKDGNPVPFASIKVKGTSTGVSADANGAYSIKANSNSTLAISGMGFMESVVVIINQSVINTVMEKDPEFSSKEIVVTGGMGVIIRTDDEYYGPYDKLKHVALIEVKDEITGKAIPNARLVVYDYVNSVDTFFTDKKGMYKIKGIKKDDEYAVKIIADGYEPNEFTIDDNDFKDRKKVWEVLLKTQKVEVKSALTLKSDVNTVRLRGMMIVNTISTEPLYVVDGTIMPKANSVNPDDIDNTQVLAGAAAVALFGPEGANGAIIMTTRKRKEKVMDTVSVSAEFGARRRRSSTMGATSMVTVCTSNYLDDAKAKLITVLTDSLKVFPNPVQRNNSFSVSIKLKETGTYQFQITDVTGKIVLLKQFIASAKNHTETVQPQNWAAGIYYVRIFNKSKLIRNTSFIFEQ